MGAQRDPTESDEHHQDCCGHNAEQSPMPCLKQRQDKQQELPVKQSCSDGVATGKAVTRPIDEGAVHEGPMPMDEEGICASCEHSEGLS